MFDVSVPAGKYIVAVSGGVDSMVLLDILAKRDDLELVIAHFEHGIRPDSDRDRQLVARIAKRYDLPFVYAHGNLGSHASEAAARETRYAFLRQVLQDQRAQAIITAHHQDDVLETVILNIVRGTGRKGLSSLGSTDDILRPLLTVPKEAIREYVRTYPDIIWHEDSTNADERYLRNYIRRQVVPRLNVQARQQLLAHAAHAGEANPRIDAMVQEDIARNTDGRGLRRHWFIMQPHDVACEVMAVWLRRVGIRDFDRRLIGDLVNAAKTALPGKRRDINAEYWLETDKTSVRLAHRTSSKKQINSV